MLRKDWLERGEVRGVKRLAIVAAVMVLAFFLFSLAGLVFQGYQLSQRTADVQADIVRLQAENERLQKEVARLQTDPAVERLAREQLGLVKEGETMAAVDFGPQGHPRKTPTPTPTPVPNWRQWWDLLANP